MCQSRRHQPNATCSNNAAPSLRPGGIFQLHLIAWIRLRDRCQRTRQPGKKVTETHALKGDGLTDGDLLQNVEVSLLNANGKKPELFPRFAFVNKPGGVLP